MPADPRVLQILFLGVLLAAGAWIRDFELQTAQIALTFAAAIATQGILGRAAKRGPVSYLSPTITALGVTLLLRADNLWAHPAAAAIAISSKFVIRGPRGRHLFNPANFGVVIALASIPGTWVSPGQWGQDVSVAGWIIALGGLVTYRARRGDISWSFLATYMGALAIRVAWLGQRWAVWSHQFDNGALLLFAFFMISDPMTIPSDWRGRLAHAAAVAAIAYVWQFGFYRNDGFIWAL
ncbi:MAG TPA: RnfABCDGE type electron transport complex subunit D, partial [Candidatus Binataceae bacterium]|nr:RnfABCDGE type electron transport complex subunit D [Candidatus Binataceae bacterium]